MTEEIAVALPVYTAMERASKESSTLRQWHLAALSGNAICLDEVNRGHQSSDSVGSSIVSELPCIK
jgi:hypothetical protein